MYNLTQLHAGFPQRPQRKSFWMQLCLAFRSNGGTVAVVLSSRSKLEMEELFRRTIPEESRFGTRFVFREVNMSNDRAMSRGY